MEDEAALAVDTLEDRPGHYYSRQQIRTISEFFELISRFEFDSPLRIFFERFEF